MNDSISKNLFRSRFEHGTPRSLEYKQGVLYGLQRVIEEIEQTDCPYRVGTCQADAWFAGNDEGRRLGLSHLETIFE